jgi:transposase
VHTASVPEAARSGLFSINLIAFVAYLKGRCHISFSALKDFFQEVLGVRISRGFLAKQVQKASGSLKGIHGQLMSRLSGEGHLHIDESGWKEKGEKRWIWAFRAERYAVFIIRGSRGEGVLEEVLGETFGGIISCDFFGAYRKFERMTGALLQFCWAHFIREVLFLLKLEDGAVRRYGRRLIKQIRLMFETIQRKGEIKERKWKGLMNEHRELIVRRALGTVPEHKDAQLIAKRLREWGEEYFRFIEAGLEPTNNPAELTIRQTVLDRVVTQGSRGIAGNEWHERFWTVLTTCTMQNISVMKYLKKCLAAFFSFDSFPNDINLAESL